MDVGITTGCRRRVERRQRSTFVLRERRSGFERRETSRSLATRWLLELRHSRAALLVLLAAVNAMNLLDHLATTRALEAGFTEGNPVMAALLASDPRVAAVVKLAAILAVSVAVWRLRRYRMILQVAVLMVVIFATVLVIHFVGAALYL